MNSVGVNGGSSLDDMGVAPAVVVSDKVCALLMHLSKPRESTSPVGFTGPRCPLVAGGHGLRSHPSANLLRVRTVQDDPKAQPRVRLCAMYAGTHEIRKPGDRRYPWRPNRSEKTQSFTEQKILSRMSVGDESDDQGSVHTDSGATVDLVPRLF